jgi:branched-chain amino acid transport system substrate-binding protein
MKREKLLTVRRLNVVTLLLATVVAALLLLGWTSAPTPTHTPSIPTATRTMVAAQTPAPATKTLKIALNNSLTWPLGVNFAQGAQVDVDEINKNGGLLIGKEKYIIQLTNDENNLDAAGAKTAAQKEIFQDGVKFILGDRMAENYVSLTEANKVVLLAIVATNGLYDKNYKYCFLGSPLHTSWVAALGWFANRSPNAKKFVGAYQDNAQGHGYGEVFSAAAKSLGYQVLDSIYYPPAVTDTSAVGTRVKTLKPDLFSPIGANPQTDSILYKGVYQAGYKGQRLGCSPAAGKVLMGLAGPDALEGFVGIAWPSEFDVPPTPVAKEWREAYTAKYKKWDYPDPVYVSAWYMLKAALQKAGSIDPEKVAAVLNNGLKFEAPNGVGQMVSRPDLGISRTVDVIYAMPIKQIEGGQVKMIDTMTLEQQLKWLKAIYGWK